MFNQEIGRTERYLATQDLSNSDAWNRNRKLRLHQVSLISLQGVGEEWMDGRYSRWKNDGMELAIAARR